MIWNPRQVQLSVLPLNCVALMLEQSAMHMCQDQMYFDPDIWTLNNMSWSCSKFLFKILKCIEGFNSACVIFVFLICTQRLLSRSVCQEQDTLVSSFDSEQNYNLDQATEHRCWTLSIYMDVYTGISTLGVIHSLSKNYFDYFL